MGKTVSVRFSGGRPVPSESKDPAVRATVQALGEAFLKRPGAVVAVPNPDLPPDERAVVEELLGRAHVDSEAGLTARTLRDSGFESNELWPVKVERGEIVAARACDFEREYTGDFAAPTLDEERVRAARSFLHLLRRRR